MKSVRFLILLSILSFSSFSYGNDCKELIKNFISPKNIASTEIKLQNLAPKRTTLFFDEDTSNQIFQQSKTNFLNSIEKELGPGSFAKVFKKIKKNEIIDSMRDSEDFYQSLLIEMKEKRKFAAILRSVFVVFSAKHESPKSFEAFTKSFGKFNDTLEFKAFQAMPEFAKRLDETFDMKKITGELKSFKPADSKSIINQLEDTKHWVLDLIEKKELTNQEFHEMRKQLKHFLTTIQVLIQLKEDKELIKSFNFLNELNDKLGAIRDMSLKKEINARDADKTIKLSEIEILPENYKKNIRIFLDGLEFGY